MKLMIVDDNPSIRRLIRTVVASGIDEVAEFEYAEDAVASYGEVNPDFVLMDLAMQPLDGITATRRIRVAHPEARVVIVSNHDSQGLREAADRAGACGYYAKENLLSLKAMLDSHRAGAGT